MREIFRPKPSTATDISEAIVAYQNWNEAYLKKRYKTMSMIPLPDEVLRCVEGPIDPGITDLVRVLNPLGVKTAGSCEGHLDGRRHPFPWVSFRDPFGNWSAPIQQLVVDPFNLTSEIPWTASAEMIRPVFKAQDESELDAFQQSAQAFANRLFTFFLEDRRIPYVNLFNF